MIQIRPSQLSDLDRLMEIFDHARKFMASVGNGNQWINGYPQRDCQRNHRRTLLRMRR